MLAITVKVMDFFKKIVLFLRCKINSPRFFLFQETRLLTLIEGVLAANIFDWGSRACVDLYHKGTIIEIYRMSRKKMQRPWRASTFKY